MSRRYYQLFIALLFASQGAISQANESIKSPNPNHQTQCESIEERAIQGLEEMCLDQNIDEKQVRTFESQMKKLKGDCRYLKAQTDDMMVAIVEKITANDSRFCSDIVVQIRDSKKHL